MSKIVFQTMGLEVESIDERGECRIGLSLCYNREGTTWKVAGKPKKLQRSSINVWKDVYIYYKSHG